MNNNQFRMLVIDKSSQRKDEGPSSHEALVSAATEPAGSLGGKKIGFMPSTPSNVKGDIDVDFVRKFRERNAALRPSTKFKSSAPKGVKYGAGHTDRVKMRRLVKDDEDEEGSKASRIKALEEQMKLGQIPVETFEALRDEITGGDISNTHLVKGLDRKLLERVRRGENVLEPGNGPVIGGPPPDLDEQLDKIGEKEVEHFMREKTDKKGNVASSAALIGRKRTRDQILAELKSQREAARHSKASVMLGDKWRKVGEQRKGKIEVDHRGREVLITIDEDGVVKKKVRKVTSQSLSNLGPEASMSLNAAGMVGTGVDSPKSAIGQETRYDEAEEDDIFEGVGTEYNPIGDDDDEDDDDEDDEDEGVNEDDHNEKSAELDNDGSEVDTTTFMPANQSSATEKSPKDVRDAQAAQEFVEKSVPPTAKRNYFKDVAVTEEAETINRFVGIRNVLTKAAKLDTPNEEEDSVGSDEESRKEQEARRQKHARMLAQKDRDLEDMEMGFGSSRFEDEEDAESDGKVRLSQWKDRADCDGGWDEEGGKSKASKNKRRAKRRKGDVNNAADIMRVIEARKAEG